MRRLYLQIYVAFVGILVLFGVLAVVFWLLGPAVDDMQVMDGVGAVLGELLPAPDEPAAELSAALSSLAARLRAELTVRASDGALLASVGDPLPAPRRPRGGWVRSRGAGPTIAFRLPDGRWLIARYPHRALTHAAGIALLAVAIAIGAYPLARRMTGRLERLQRRVDQLGAGDLSARVEVEGKDEIASLARSFNLAAERIERLVRGQRSMLAAASHELRSPLARLRVAVELPGSHRPELREQIEKDIAELDELIEELLLASRLEAVSDFDQMEDVDLLAVVAEEAARTGTTVTGKPVQVRGDPRLLRRMVRNLLENAHRYSTVVDAWVGPDGPSSVRLEVADRGPGVAEALRDRIFEPFFRLPSQRPDDRGAGLGLALVRQIARRHGGDARCLPREGGGTRFEVTLG
jgi:signal transduction histidine kinase